MLVRPNITRSSILIEVAFSESMKWKRYILKKKGLVPWWGFYKAIQTQKENENPQGQWSF